MDIDLADVLKHHFSSDVCEASIQLFESYTKIPSAELIEKAKFSLTKPYGMNHILTLTESFGISLAQIGLSQGTSMHFHTRRKELFYVKQGILTLYKADDVYTIQTNSIGFSTPLEKHSLKNENQNTLEILEIFLPPLIDDKVRVKDQYDRKLGTVSHLE